LTLNANGGFTYTPAADFQGEDSFTYQARDGSDPSGTATVRITVPAP
jgi:large repetitive protein